MDSTDSKSVNMFENYVGIKALKIEGWLYVVAFGIIFRVLYLPYFTIENLITPWINGKFSFTNQSYFFPIFSFELINHIILIIASIFLLYLFFSKKKILPITFIYVFTFNIVIVFFDNILCDIFLKMPMWDQDSTKELIKLFLYVCLWGTYLRISQRSNKTFVYNGPNFIKNPVFKKSLYTISILYILSFILIFSFPNINKTSAMNEKHISSQDIAKKALASTVVVNIYDKNKKHIGLGSGFFIMNNIVVTNNHVIENAIYISIRFAHSRTEYFVDSILSEDKHFDLALLKVSEITGVPLELDTFSNLKVGEKIYTAGSPEGLDGTFSDGMVSNLYETGSVNLIQISAPISQGSSGGPILNEKGKVVAVSTLVSKSGQNLNFGIPVDYISNIIARTSQFHPLEKNENITSNPSILKIMPFVCETFTTVNMPEEYFEKLKINDMNDKETRAFLDKVLPNTKAAWFAAENKVWFGLATHKFIPHLIKKLSLDEIKKSVDKLISETENMYKSQNPGAKFITANEELSENFLKYSIDAEYTLNNIKYKEYRAMYYFLPYCRLDYVLTSSLKNEKLNNILANYAEESVEYALPNIYTGKNVYWNKQRKLEFIDSCVADNKPKFYFESYCRCITNKFSDVNVIFSDNDKIEIFFESKSYKKIVSECSQSLKEFSRELSSEK